MSTINENDLPFLRRLYIYQKERFPVIQNSLVIAVFGFSAISFSRICRGVEGFINPLTYAVGIFTTITLFFLVRIFDEFKDREEDAKFRSYLPVPRGLISFKELRNIGIVIFIIQLIVNIFFYPKMLYLFIPVIIYLALMGKEFFVSSWLKKNIVMYIITHMMIIPLIDVYASGLDWWKEGAEIPRGLLIFLGVSYMNGVVIEFGRKIRPKELEEEGYETYSALYGANKATIIWILVMFVTFVLSVFAASYANYGMPVYIALGVCFVLFSAPGFVFMKNKTKKTSKFLEYASALWTISMYLILGAAPMIGEMVTGR
ncbi:MAG: UbiA family prenyltransferase [Bacteroidota bacterium]|nr:UbiA family prenyltransferase [Bacteroidota bacterium]